MFRHLPNLKIPDQKFANNEYDLIFGEEKQML